jgi:uncharacterized protein YgiM (DUF1202 family)
MRLLRSVLAVLAILLVAGSTSSQPAPTLEPNERVVVGLNVRAEPNSNAQIVAVLRQGDRVTQIGSVPFWYRVRLENGSEGNVATHTQRSSTWARSIPCYLGHRRCAELEAGVEPAFVWMTCDCGAELVAVARRAL